jgi:hypothetical protein
MALIWIVLDYIAVCIFLKSPFYSCYNAKFFLGLIGTNFIGIIYLFIFFAKSCLSTVHNL